ncbi:MAG: insulinase family protein, partial [Planctomycetota bacterium]
MKPLVDLPIPRLPVVRSQLDNGMRVCVSARAGAPVVAALLHVRGAIGDEPAGKEGLAFLVGATLDQGTRSHSDEEIAALLEPAGGVLAGDAFGLNGAIAGGDWKLLVSLLAELACAPRFPADKIERQRARVVERLRVEADDPAARASKSFRELVYGAHFLGRPQSGTVESLQRIRVEDLRAHHARTWGGKRATLVVCGDVDPREVVRVVQREFRSFDAGAAEELRDGPYPQLERRIAAHRMQREQTHVYFGHLGVRYTHPDYAKLVVLDHVLGTGHGFTNRIARRLRDEQGLAYAVNASIHASASRYPGAFTAYIGTAPENVEPALRGFLEEITRIRDAKVAPDELRLAQDYLVGSYALSFERSSERAQYLLSAELFGLGDDHLERLVASFRAVSADDVLEVARKHLHPERACVAASGPIDRARLDAAL